MSGISPLFPELSVGSADTPALSATKLKFFLRSALFRLLSIVLVLEPNFLRCLTTRDVFLHVPLIEPTLVYRLLVELHGTSHSMEQT